MPRVLRVLSILSVLALAPPAHAGWTLQWSMTGFNQKGIRTPTQTATESIANDRSRSEQPTMVTITDYGTLRYTLMNPAKQYYWNGPIQDYVRESSRNRAAGMQERIGHLLGKKDPEKAMEAFMPPPVDPAKLPPVSVTSSGLREKIASYETEKYEVRVDGELFLEIWVAPALNISGDLNVNRLLEAKRQMSAGVMGKSSAPFNAVYRSDEYRNLLQKGLPLKEITHHIAGGFERVATAVQQGDIPAAQFEVPSDYRRVRLGDVLDAPPAVETPTR